MPRNLEIKVRVASFERSRRRLKALGARHVSTFAQRDTYFAIGAVRLKLREQPQGHQLILYVRPTRRGRRTSWYQIVPVHRPDLWKRAFKAIDVVRKRRELWRYRRTRIHLDSVRGLGKFVELETELKGGTRMEFSRLLRALGMSERDGEAGSYVELSVCEKSRRSPARSSRRGTTSPPA